MANRKPGVLVVNDDEGGRCLTVRALQPYFRVAQAATGAEAVNGSLALPDLVLLDVNLPDMSGFEVCRSIKENPATAHIPVLHMSATALDTSSRTKGLENGADGFLTQPVDGEIIVATINALLRTKKAEAELAARNAELSMLTGIDKIFLTTSGEETWQALLGAVLQFFSSPAGAMGYVNGQDEMVFCAFAGAGRQTIADKGARRNIPHSDWAKSPWGRAMESGAVLAGNEPAGFELPEGHLKIERFLSLPLMDGGQPAGHITIANKKLDYTTEEISLAGRLGGHIAPLLKGRLQMAEQEKRNRQMTLHLANAQKIESLGQLAGGIAHDFNNILTGLTGNLSVLNARSGLDGEARETIKDMLAAASEAHKVTQQLLTFAKGGQPVKKIFSFRTALASWCSFGLRGSKTKPFVDIPLDLWAVNGDEGQLGQVVNNLLRNALEAMPEGGGLKVLAENLEQAGGTGLPLPPGKYLRLTVADTGVGIPAKYLDKIFEPYFTTKQRGHGLGLAMVRSIVKSHGGEIAVRSGPGSGTEFTVYLPAADAAPQQDLAAPGKAQKGTGRLLVMDDEEIVQKALARMLAALGYTSACAADGKEALKLYKEALGGPGAFKAVIMDLTIPGGMGGAEAIKELLALDPAAKVVVSSGYSGDNLMADYKALGFRAALVKPYRYEDLADVLATL